MMSDDSLAMEKVAEAPAGLDVASPPPTVEVAPASVGDAPSRGGWLLWLALGVVSVAAFQGLFAYFWERWTQDQSPFGYGYFVPPTVLFLVWCRLRLSRGRPRVSGHSLALVGIVLLALTQCVALLSGVTLLQSIVFYGLLLLVPYYLWGPYVFAAIGGPLAYSAVMIPWPGQFTANLLLPSQLVSTKIATAMLSSVGTKSYVEGTLVYLPSYNFEVAAACSGLTILFPVVAIAILNVMMVRAAMWRKLVVVAFALPLAVLANGIRIAGIGLIGDGGSPQLADQLHDPSGWIAVGIAVVMLMMVQAAMKCNNFLPEYMPPFGAEPKEVPQ
jgi:exosortase